MDIVRSGSGDAFLVGAAIGGGKPKFGALSGRGERFRLRVDIVGGLFVPEMHPKLSDGVCNSSLTIKSLVNVIVNC